MVGYRRIPLLDEKAGAVLPDSPLEREIKDGIFDGTFAFSILPGHEAYDAVELRRSTVYVYDDGEEVFRGRPIREETGLYGEKRYECEGEMTFLADVPNVFSKKIPVERSDRVGTETETKQIDMTTIPTGLVHPGSTRKDRLTRFGESRTYNHKTVYRSVADNVGKNVYDSTDSFRYWFQERDEGAVFDVEYEVDGTRLHYKIPLHACTYDVTLYRGSGMYRDFYRDPHRVTAKAFYLGNIAMVDPGDVIVGGEVVPSPFHTADFDPGEEITYRVKTGGPAGEDAVEEQTVQIGSLPFCIVHYTQSQYWWIAMNELLFWEVWQEDILYATSPYDSPLTRVDLNVYRMNESDIGALYRSVICPYEAEPLRGYNAYVPPERRIYRGIAEVGGRVEHAATQSCREDLKAWLEETGGYAKIRRVNDANGERRVLDLLADSGEYRDDFRVLMDENLMEAARTDDCTGIVTGVYVRGFWGDGNCEVTLEHVATATAETAQAMDDKTKRYRFTGTTPETYTTGKYYRYDSESGKWEEIQNPEHPETAKTVELPQDMTDTGKLYQFIGGVYGTGTVAFIEGKTYYFSALSRWEEDPEAKEPFLDDGFSADFDLGVLWHHAARKLYGTSVKYLETDASEIDEGRRLQYLVAKGQDEIRENLTAFESFEIDATDPRLISEDGGRPELGNYYQVELPHLGITDYKRLTKIKTNPADAGECKMTFGGSLPTLSDYVAKKGERL